MGEPLTLSTTGLTAWLVTGLVIQAVVCAAQWRHLNRLQRSGQFAGRACRYGQRRAVFQGLVFAERLARIGLWLGTGWLVVLHGLVATGGYLSGVAFAVVFAMADQALQRVLPWARWYWVERAAGVSTTTAATVIGDAARQWLTQTFTAFAGAVFVLWPFYTLGSAWQWPASGLCVVVGAGVLLWLRPQVIEPWFHRFTELPAGDLRSRLAALMHRCGAELDSVLVMDTSRRSRLANAQFTGWGRRKRVVLSDTLVAQLDPAELEAVMAHELGHFQCGHLRRYYGLQAVLLWLGWFVFGTLAPSFLASTEPAFAAAGAYLLLPALAWPLSPWFAALRRRYEYEADAFAAHHAGRGALLSALERLFANNLGAPTMARGYALMYATHPPADRRLARLRP
ncbi:M48 family metalloprotease [Salinisphaera sp. T31B1]|uniref:M48 family metalloprotease n=1 Tax=Salinisphaera sp. T31B1 TaxID=727963 RepID=UPI00333E2751